MDESAVEMVADPGTSRRNNKNRHRRLASATEGGAGPEHAHQWSTHESARVMHAPARARQMAVLPVAKGSNGAMEYSGVSRVEVGLFENQYI